MDLHQPRCHFGIGPKGASQKSITAEEIVPNVSNASNVTDWEIRNSYRLSAMETAFDDTDETKWVMRQMAVHHFLDLSRGDSFTLTVNANPNKIIERIKSIGQGTAPSTLPECFVASLQTQLLGFDWSAEGWEKYISVLERRIRQISAKVSVIRMRSEGNTLLERQLISEEARHRHQYHYDEIKPQTFSVPILLHWFKCFFRRDTLPDTDTSSSSNSIEKKWDGEDECLMSKLGRNASKHFEISQEFPFEGLQTLQSACTKLREAKLVMKLNYQVLQEIRQHYQAAFSSEDFPLEIKNSCGLAYRNFEHRIIYLEKLLRAQCSRVDTLTHMASDGNGLVSALPSQDRGHNADISVFLVRLYPTVSGMPNKPVLCHSCSCCIGSDGAHDQRYAQNCPQHGELHLIYAYYNLVCLDLSPRHISRCRLHVASPCQSICWVLC